ncbi:hypothetical protein [Flexivirga oryzae]|uniref:Uncharacterized protein n=1 Tax=Flexivirga oryzae TaxID=1794944 RepID=A0A839N2C9_9MICO|nr:hypothetical protein [Flexivirga oryzae]MBB2890949.1 hypothetical protein [Flexivirga oryzae]
MSRTYKDSRGKQYAKSHPKGRQHQPGRLIVRGIRRRPVDVKRLGRALLDLAQAQAEAEARAAHDEDTTESSATGDHQESADE